MNSEFSGKLSLAFPMSIDMMMGMMMRSWKRQAAIPEVRA